MLYHQPRHCLHRILRELFYSLYNPLKNLYNHLYRPHTEGVKVVLWSDEKILLVRIGYAHRLWGFPGGKVERGESPKEAAKRELIEETAIRIEELQFLGERFVTREGKNDTVYHYTGVSPTEDVTIDDQEIIDAGWFNPDHLPNSRSPNVDIILKMYNDWK